MKPLFALLALSLVGLIAWIAMGTGTDPSPTGNIATPRSDVLEETAGAKQAPRLSDEGQAELRGATAESEEIRTEVAVQPASIELEAAASETAASVDDGVLFTVLLAGTDQPLPGAKLIYFSPKGMKSQQAQEMMAKGMGIEAMLDKIGIHYTCDERGQVRVKILGPDGFLSVKGSLDGVTYSAMQEPGLEDMTIYVSPEAGFQVTVTDMGGSPLEGMVVELVALWAERDERGSFAMSARETDDEGVAYLVNAFMSMVTQSEGMFDGDQGMTPALALSGLYREPVLQEVDWRRSTPALVTFSRPDVGSVAVTVIGADGEPITDGNAFAVISGMELTASAGPTSTSIVASPPTDKQGLMLLTNIQVGLPFDVFFVLKNGDAIAGEHGLVLREAGEQLAVELQSKQRMPMVFGRALDDEGSPMANTEVGFASRSVWDGQMDWYYGKTTTDSEGRFETKALWSGDTEICLYLPSEVETDYSSDLFKTGDAPNSRIDLGDVVIGLPPVLVAGRVVDLKGNGARVNLRLEANKYVRGKPVLGPGESANESGGERPPYRRWQAVSNSDGTFEVRGRASEAPLLLTAISNKYMPNPGTHVTRGDENVILVLSEAARFHFEINDPRKHLTDAINLFVTPMDEGLTEDDRKYGSFGETKSQPLLPGHYKFSLCLGVDQDHPLYTGEVTLKPGEDQDLGLINLDRVVYCYQLEVIDSGSILAISATSQGESVTGSFHPKEGPGGFDVFSLEPIDEVGVQTLSGVQTFSVVEGLNVLSWE